MINRNKKKKQRVRLNQDEWVEHYFTDLFYNAKTANTTKRSTTDNTEMK